MQALPPAVVVRMMRAHYLCRVLCESSRSTTLSFNAYLGGGGHSPFTDLPPVGCLVLNCSVEDLAS